MPKKVKRKKGRVLWAVMTNGNLASDIGSAVYAYKNKISCQRHCYGTKDLPVKFVECPTD